MVEDFTLHEGAALYGLLAETECDIVLKLDREGVVVHASAAIGRLGIDMPDMLIAPHLADLAEPVQADKLRAFVEVVMRGGTASGWFEFAARTAEGGTNWFTLQLRPMFDGAGEAYGAIGIMRSIQERRPLEERLFAATLTDPLTGLANRPAFQVMLRHLVRRRQGGSLVLIDIGHVRPLSLRHGARAGDRVVGAYAGLLRDLLHRDQIVARIGDERFAVLMPDEDPAAAQTLASAVIAQLAEAAQGRGEEAIDLRASVGIAQIRGTADATLQRAELALVHARARGQGRVESAEAFSELRRRTA